jgi:hypothetical protein
VGEDERDRLSEGGERDCSRSLYQSSVRAFYFRMRFRVARPDFGGGHLLTCFAFL